MVQFRSDETPPMMISGNAADALFSHIAYAMFEMAEATSLAVEGRMDKDIVRDRFLRSLRVENQRILGSFPELSQGELDAVRGYAVRLERFVLELFENS